MDLSLENFYSLNKLNDQELEQYLLDESNRDQMVAYFGEDEYNSLREILTTKQDFAELETEIILLPGIMGSELADADNNKVWVNVKGIVLDGNFLRLEYSDDEEQFTELKAVGLYRKAYFKTIKWLENRGYQVHTFPYDWRKPIDESAHLLQDFVEAKAGEDHKKEFVFVTHSMGGLVTRRYLEIFGDEAKNRLEKLIMLGTPNKGSYLPFQAMKGNTDILKIAGLIYGGEVIRRIVQTLPGLYELCPDPKVFGQEQIYKSAFWGEDSMIPAHLEAAREFHEKDKAIIKKKMFLIANNSDWTITRVEREESGGNVKYKFLGAKVGDKTVPFDSAYIDGVSTYLVKAEHGKIQKDKNVLFAIDEIINQGKTDYLDKYKPVFAIEPEDTHELKEIELEQVILEF